MKLFGQKIINIQLSDYNINIYYEDGTCETVPYNVENYEKYLKIVLNQNRRQYNDTNKNLKTSSIMAILSYLSLLILVPAGFVLGKYVGALIGLGVSFAAIEIIDNYVSKVMKQAFREDKLMLNSLGFISSSYKTKAKTKKEAIAHIKNIIKINFPEYAEEDTILELFAMAYYDDDSTYGSDYVDDSEIIQTFSLFIENYKSDAERLRVMESYGNIITISQNNKLPKFKKRPMKAKKEKGKILQFKPAK